MFTNSPIKIFGEAKINFTFSFAKALFIGDSRDFDKFTIFLLFIKQLKITKNNTKKQNAKSYEELLAFI